MKAFMKALGWCLLALIVFFGAVVLFGTLWFAWPVLIMLLIFGLPFIIIGIIAGKKDNDK